MEEKKPKNLTRILFMLAALVLLFKLYRDNNRLNLFEIQGVTMGSISYSIKYKYKEDLQLKNSIDSVLQVFNQTFSTYLNNSEISEFNKKDTIFYQNEWFYPVLVTSKNVFENTNGAFDPTVATLVNEWGFGPKKEKKDLSKITIDSLLQFVGFDKIKFTEKMATKLHGVQLDLSAIAKGYAVDVIANFFDKKGIENYLIEIGGEIIVKGENEKNAFWTIGIQNPREEKVFATLNKENIAMATSGNYRNFYKKNGKIVAHILDPRTGYTTESEVLSASVIAKNCVLADAYATAFMVLGIEKSMELLKNQKDIEAIFIFQENNKLKTVMSEGIKGWVVELENKE